MNPWVILGGSGNTGIRIAELLLKHGRMPLVLAGRDRAKAEAAAHHVDAMRTGRVTAAWADARSEGLYSPAVAG